MKKIDSNKVERIAKKVIAYDNKDIDNIVRLFVGDKNFAISRLVGLEPFKVKIKTSKDAAKYNKLYNEFFNAIHSAVEKYRKKFEEL